MQRTICVIRNEIILDEALDLIHLTPVEKRGVTVFPSFLFLEAGFLNKDLVMVRLLLNRREHAASWKILRLQKEGEVEDGLEGSREREQKGKGVKGDWILSAHT